MAEGATPAERTTGGKEAPAIPGTRQAAVARVSSRVTPNTIMRSEVPKNRIREQAQRQRLSPRQEARQDRYEERLKSNAPRNRIREQAESRGPSGVRGGV